jgi:16S rRNA (cytosine1402-N4)-methyltransferase
VSFSHATVLLDEAVALLDPREGAVIVDCTLGGGGHSEALLAKGAVVYAFDRDPRALAAASERLARFGDRFHPLQGNFQDARALLDGAGVGRVDGLLADLGVSSPQLDEAERGFSFGKPGPLDMRMGPDAEPLADFLARASEDELARVIRDYGEEPNARRIAKAIKAGSFADTGELAAAIGAAIPRKLWPKHIHPATRTFQALRIAVNRELEALDRVLADLPRLIAVGGRAAFISFHSLEDRRVKDVLRELESHCVCPPGLPVCACGRPGDFQVLTKKPITASEAEVAQNPRSRSAKLRGAERIR